MLRSPGECPRCGTVQPLIALDDHGAEVCGPCVGFAGDYSCRRCGGAGNPHSRGRCAHCGLAERVNALLTEPDGAVRPATRTARGSAGSRSFTKVRTTRNAALAADLPSPILADLTGMHRHTAIRWVLYARRDWAEYLAARAEDEAKEQEEKGWL